MSTQRTWLCEVTVTRWSHQDKDGGLVGDHGHGPGQSLDLVGDHGHDPRQSLTCEKSNSAIRPPHPSLKYFVMADLAG